MGRSFGLVSRAPGSRRPLPPWPSAERHWALAQACAIAIATVCIQTPHMLRACTLPP